MITKNQIKNASEYIKSENGKIKSADNTFNSLSRVCREIKLDNELRPLVEGACEKLGINLADITVAFVLGSLHASQFVAVKVGKDVKNLCATFVEAKVTDEVEATLPDGSKKKIRVPRKDEEGNVITEVKARPIKDGKWSIEALFTLLAQARELNAAAK